MSKFDIKNKLSICESAKFTRCIFFRAKFSVSIKYDKIPIYNEKKLSGLMNEQVKVCSLSIVSSFKSNIKTVDFSLGICFSFHIGSSPHVYLISREPDSHSLPRVRSEKV